MRNSLRTEARQKAVRDFFYRSGAIDYSVLRPLSHIRFNWDVMWDRDLERYKPEEDSFSDDLNELIEQIANLNPPAKYHDNEDRLAEFVRERLSWKIRKEGRRWVGADYQFIFEQGGFDDHDMSNLLLAATGRVHAAISRGQRHFDDMGDSHQNMLAAVLSIILYHRDCRT
jgi:hypothetical protein